MSISSTTPTTTSSVDVSGFDQMLEKEDLSIPCEASRFWHASHEDAPAVWATWWNFTCDCQPGFKFMCDPCKVALLTFAGPTACKGCHAVYDRPSTYLVRLERIK